MRDTPNFMCFSCVIAPTDWCEAEYTVDPLNQTPKDSDTNLPEHAETRACELGAVCQSCADPFRAHHQIIRLKSLRCCLMFQLKSRETWDQGPYHVTYSASKPTAPKRMLLLTISVHTQPTPQTGTAR